jgi:glucose-6-phosphate isomerase, archaeal
MCHDQGPGEDMMNTPMLTVEELVSCFDPATGAIPGAPVTRRHLSDLRGCFADAAAYEAALAAGDPLIYSVAAIDPADGEGDLHYGVGLLMPGRIGQEYFMTKGHLHAWRPAAEFYFGLSGEGAMLLEDEATGESRLAPLRPHQAVYVLGHTAHRTVNTGRVPLTYIGVYPAKAGHDYSAIAKKNFRCVVVEQEGRPALVKREPGA